MGKPVATADNIAMAFPDICLTVVGPASVPLPYPNIADLAQAKDVSDEANKALLVGGKAVLLKISTVADSSGNEPATAGVTSGITKGQCYMDQSSESVFYGSAKAGLVRFMDATGQNAASAQGPANAKGFVLSAVPTVLIGD